jgi:hypothetical protein
VHQNEIASKHPRTVHAFLDCSGLDLHPWYTSTLRCACISSEVCGVSRMLLLRRNQPASAQIKRSSGRARTHRCIARRSRPARVLSVFGRSRREAMDDVQTRFSNGDEERKRRTQLMLMGRNPAQFSQASNMKCPVEIVKPMTSQI